jgi:hypothetical protein
MRRKNRPNPLTAPSGDGIEELLPWNVAAASAVAIKTAA